MTDLLYETDGLMTEFDAVVTKAGKDDERDYVLLDRTAFFPEGGGQQADTGMLVTDSGSRIRVTDVQSLSGQIRHYTDIPIEKGSKVTGLVDAEQRFSRMQNHGAEHVISGLAHLSYGYENVGFHMTDREAVFDLGGPLTDEQIRDIEERANRIVFRDVPITIGFPTPEEAAKLQYRSKLDISDNVRLVTIEGVDTCACCAPHLRSTGQIGLIKILDFMPHRGGTRITMTAGINAYLDYVNLHDSNSEIMEMLSAKRIETAGSVRELTKRLSALREENAALRRKMTDMVTEDVIKKLREKDPEDDRPELIFTGISDPKGLRDLVNECTKVYGGIVCAFYDKPEGGFGYIFAVRAENADSAGLLRLTEDFNSSCNGRGGGSKLMTQGTSMASREDTESFFCG